MSYGSDSEDYIGFSSKDGAFYTDDAVIINGKWSIEYTIKIIYFKI